jgi:hypothetical protein
MSLIEQKNYEKNMNIGKDVPKPHRIHVLYKTCIHSSFYRRRRFTAEGSYDKIDAYYGIERV